MKESRLQTARRRCARDPSKHRNARGNSVRVKLRDGGRIGGDPKHDGRMDAAEIHKAAGLSLYFEAKGHLDTERHFKLFVSLIQRLAFGFDGKRVGVLGASACYVGKFFNHGVAVKPTDKRSRINGDAQIGIVVRPVAHG